MLYIVSLLFFAAKVQKSPASFGFNSLYDRNSVVRKMNCTIFLFRKSEKPNKRRVFDEEIHLLAYK